MLVLDKTETVLLLCNSFQLCGMMHTANYLFEKKGDKLLPTFLCVTVGSFINLMIQYKDIALKM